MMCTGCASANSTDASPPFDCINCNGAVSPSACNRADNAVRYARTTGCTYAFTTVVLVRGYSLISGNISWLTDTARSGSAALTRAATIRSCAGLA